MTFCFSALLLLSAVTANAQRQDVIRGRVLASDGQPIEGVNVKATSASGLVTRTTRTDAKGQFMLGFSNGEGDYWMEFRRIGYAPKRFEIKRRGDEEVILADTRMASSIASVDAVVTTSTATRALPARTDAIADLSGTDRALGSAALSPDVAGDLAAAAALQPGVQLIPGLDGAADAFSALGIGPDQNSTTVNGLGAALTALPRDAQTIASLRTFNYDPAIGGFGGAQIAVMTRPGTNISTRLLSSLARSPATEFTTDIAEEQGVKNTLLSLGGNAAGPLRPDHAFYSLSYQLDRDSRDFRSVFHTNDAGLAAAGVARDSVDRLLGILATRGVPAGVAASTLNATNRVALQGNIDFVPGTSGVGHALTLSLATQFAQTSNIAGGLGALLAAPSHNADSHSATASIALRHSNYFWFGILSNTTLGASVTSNATSPDLLLPEGRVRVRSTLPDGGSAIRTLSFGGWPADQDGRTTAIEILNQSIWYEGRNRHALKLTSNLRLEQFSSEQSNNRFGAFTYASLADLDAGRAERFDRLLEPRSLDGRQLVLAAALGDSWRPSRDFQLQYGLRLDGNRALTHPAFNEDLADAFGVRNDRAPHGLYLSPRLGLQYTYGELPQMSIIPVARPPRAVVQGGIGIFQNIAAARMLLAPALLNTGLVDAAQTLQCIGAAAPVPDWTSYSSDIATIPASCAEGSSATPFASGAPSVTLYDEQFRQPRVLRSSLGWSGPVLANRLVLGVSLQYQRGFDQPATVDINLDTIARFTLTGEGGRRVYAPAEAIVSFTAGVAPGASRRDAGFNRVNVLRSGLGQETRLLTLSAKPALTSAKFMWSMSYTLQHARDESIGFTSAGIENPFETSWGPSLLARRHAVTATVFYNLFDLIRFNALFGVISGARFTPMVLGDVNGDGSIANDRAFVFDPAAISDTSVAAAMRRVLGRECLARQLGAVAARGSCRGPWQSNANLNVSLNAQKVRLPGRMRVTLNINNPLVLADILAHGQNNIRGWGQAIAPDQTLLAVRGFDPVARRFTYDVNERFGSTRPTQVVQRGQTYVGLNIALDIGAPRERQLLAQRLSLGRSREGTTQSAPLLKVFATSTIPNPLVQILQVSDSLQLTRAQADSLVAMNRTYTIHADSLWSNLAAYLAALPATYDEADAYRRYRSARERTIDRLIELSPRVQSLLTPLQKRKLTQAVRDWLDVRVLRAVRSSTSG